jgi:RNA polymerase sigma-70 factor (ECF subfamily)
MCVNMSGEAVNDDQLISATVSGDSEAFGQLVDRYQNRLFNSMVYVAGNHNEAEEVVQEAFVQAFIKLNTFAGRSSFYTWLYRIAFNYFISRKRRKREILVGAIEETSIEPLDGEGPAENRMLQAERATQVREALMVLSDEHRTVMVLREIDGCGYAEIAEILDLPVGTVRSRIHRARSEMREYLQDNLENHPA